MSKVPEFNVIVIGSGNGRSIAANRLAKAGKKVRVLERGHWRDILPVRSMGVELQIVLMDMFWLNTTISLSYVMVISTPRSHFYYSKAPHRLILRSIRS